MDSCDPALMLNLCYCVVSKKLGSRVNSKTHLLAMLFSQTFPEVEATVLHENEKLQFVHL